MDNSAPENWKAYASACRNQYVEQQDDRETIIAKTFALLALGIVLPFVSNALGDGTPVFMSVAALFVIVLGSYILLPKRWYTEFDLLELRELLNADNDQFMLAMADAHKRVVEGNRKMLLRHYRAFQFIVALVAIEAVMSIFLLIP